MRSTARDGFLNRLEVHGLTSCEPRGRSCSGGPSCQRAANKLLIDNAILKLPTRPNPLSTMAPYSSWSSLTDRRYDSRHLPPAAQAGLPDAERVAALFARGPETKLCPKSTVMFAYFAQWFTDGFLRSDRRPERDPRRNDTNHEIDLTPLYGVRPEQTDQLREARRRAPEEPGPQRRRVPAFLCENGAIKPEFSTLSVVRPETVPDGRRDALFAAAATPRTRRSAS